MAWQRPPQIPDDWVPIRVPGREIALVKDHGDDALWHWQPLGRSHTMYSDAPTYCGATPPPGNPPLIGFPFTNLVVGPKRRDVTCDECWHGLTGGS